EDFPGRERWYLTAPEVFWFSLVLDGCRERVQVGRGILPCQGVEEERLEFGVVHVISKSRGDGGLGGGEREQTHRRGRPHAGLRVLEQLRQHRREVRHLG